MSMLIDADLLKKEINALADDFIQSGCGYGDINDMADALLGIIDEQPTVNKLISCKDILPPDGKEVLICTNETIWIASRFTDRPWEMWEYKDGSLGDISERDYWMPLPEPYKED